MFFLKWGLLTGGEKLLLFHFESWNEWIFLIKSLVLTAPFLNNRWDPQRRQREQDPLLAAETCTILTLRRKLWLRWRADPQEDPLLHCHKELLVLSLNQHLNGTIWMLFIWWEKALEWKHSQTNSHLILFPVTFSNYKGGIGRPAIMATFSLGSCGSSSFHPLHQLVSVIMLPITSFKPGSGQKKAEGSLHLICLPVTGDLIPYFFETKKPFFCFLLKKKSMLYFFHLHKIWVGRLSPVQNWDGGWRQTGICH